jgi:hypothetical protein
MSAELIIGESWDAYTKSDALGSSATAAWKTMSNEAWSSEFLEVTEGGRYVGASSKYAAGGAGLDALVTKNKSFEDCFVTSPFKDFKSVEARAWRDAQIAAGREVVTEKQVREIRAAEKRANEAIGILANGAPYEFQATLRGEISGIKVQTRPDILIHAETPIFCDLKYVSQFDSFDRNVFDTRLEIQLALGSSLAIEAGILGHRMAFLVIESETEQPRSDVIFVDDIDLLHMRRKLATRLRQISETRDSAIGFVDVVQFRTLRLPGWQRKQLEEAE